MTPRALLPTVQTMLQAVHTMLQGALAVLLAALAVLLAASCSKTIDDHGAAEVDFGNAKRVVSAIFFAAQTGESHHLASLCDPLGEANRHVQRICSQTAGGSDWSAFENHFSKGRLIGEARISGDHALVNFAFGPSGTEAETMELVLREGKWYLLAF